MTHILTEENALPVLLRQLHKLAVDICTELEQYLERPSKHHLIVFRAKSQRLCCLSAFAGNKRLKAFCKQFARCCELLMQPEADEKAASKLLMKAGLILAASLSHPAYGLQVQYLAEEIFDLLRAFRGGNSDDSIEVQNIKISAVAKQFWRCLHRAAAKALGSMRKDLEPSVAREMSAQTRVVLLCFERFANYSLGKTWDDNTLAIKLLTVEAVSARLASSKGNSGESSKLMPLPMYWHKSATDDVFLLIQQRLFSPLLANDSLDVQFLSKIERAVQEALLVCQILEANNNLRQLVHFLQVTRRYVRRLQCCSAKSPKAVLLSLQCLIATYSFARALIYPDKSFLCLSTNPFALEKQCETFIRANYEQYNEARKERVFDEGICQDAFYKEICAIKIALADYVRRVKNQNEKLLAESLVFWILHRFKVAAFCVEDYALFESVWWVQRIYGLAIEQKVLLSKQFLALLPELIGIAQEPSRTEKQHRHDCFSHAFEKLELSLLFRNLMTNFVSSESLANFLSENIKELITYPDQLRSMHAAASFQVDASRRCIVELNMLSAGARDLNVDRVADLSEALEQTHSALCAIPDLANVDVPTLLGPGHQLLRESLNRAAARQQVEDVRGVVAGLYAFLEKGLPVVAPKWRRRGLRQRSRKLVAHLQSNVGTVETLLQTKGLRSGEGKHAHLEHLIVEQRSLLQQLQEELDEARLVRFVRVRSRLQRFVARQANALVRQVRLQLRNESLQFKRDIVASLMVPLQQVLRIVIELGIEDESIRRLRLKPKIAVISMQVRQLKTGICVDVSDDGQEIALTAIEPVQQLMHAIGGELTFNYLPLQGNRLKVVLAS